MHLCWMSQFPSTNSISNDSNSAKDGQTDRGRGTQRRQPTVVKTTGVAGRSFHLLRKQAQLISNRGH